MRSVGCGLVASGRCVRAVAVPPSTDAVHTGLGVNESTDSSRHIPYVRSDEVDLLSTRSKRRSRFKGAEQVYRAQKIPGRIFQAPDEGVGNSLTVQGVPDRKDVWWLQASWRARARGNTQP